MSWEEVEAWPGGERGGAFRGAAEPIVAERRGVTLRERLRLFWHSTPEHPLSRVAERVVVTPRYVYVQRREGRPLRVPLERLHGERLEAGRVVYGVRGGDDLLLPYRDRCEVQVQLDAAVRGGEPIEPWRASRDVGKWLTLALSVVILAMASFGFPPFSPVRESVGQGLLVLAYASAAVLFVVWGPTHWRIDSVAVTRVRGVFRTFSFSIPPERVRRVVVSGLWFTKRGTSHQIGWEVRLELVAPARLGSTALPSAMVALQSFSGREETLGRAEADARALAERLRRLLSLEEPVSVRRGG